MAARAIALSDTVYSLYEGKQQGYSEKTLWCDESACVVYEGEYACIPVTDFEEGEDITPVVVYGGATSANLQSAWVWPDSTIYSKVFMGSHGGWTQSKDGRFRTYVDTAAKTPVLYRWPKDLWPSGKPDQGRKWIVVPTTRSGVAFGSPSFKVGIYGTDVYSRTIYINRTDSLYRAGFALTPQEIFGVEVSGYLSFSPAANHAGDRDAADVRQWQFAAGTSSKKMSLVAHIPEAGELVIPGWDLEADGGYDLITSGMEHGYFENDGGWGKGAYVIVSTNSEASSVIIRRYGRTMECDGMWFYPAKRRSVAVRCATKSLRPADGGGNVEEILGTVRGTGVYNEGETVHLSVDVPEGVEFLGWRGPLELDYDTTGGITNLRFRATANVCGSASEHKVVTIEPLWRPRQSAFTLPIPAGYGTVAGNCDCAPGSMVTNTVASTVKGQCVRYFTTGTYMSQYYTAEGAQVIYKALSDGYDVSSVMYAHFGAYPALTVTANDASLGTITPKSGGYPAGSTISLKATAKKGYAFASWEKDGNVFSITPTRQITKGTDDETVQANFITAEEDVSHGIGLHGEDECEVKAGELSEVCFWVDSISMPKITVKGLPSGMSAKLDERISPYAGSIFGPSETDPFYGIPDIYHALVISGTPKKPGVYSVEVSLSNQSIKTAVKANFTVKVANFTSPYIYGLDSAFDAYSLTAGVAVGADAIPFSVESGWKTSVSGLPSGLKYNTKTGLIEGVATKPGTYTVIFTAQNGKEKSQASITVTVLPMDSSAVGTFNGIVRDSSGKAAGNVKITVTAAGRISAKVATASGTKSFSVSGWSSLDYNGRYTGEIALKGADLAMVLDPSVPASGMQVKGSCILAAGGEEFTFVAQRNPFGKTGKVYDNQEAVDFVNSIAGTYGFDLEECGEDEWCLVEPANPKKPGLKLTVTKNTGATKVSGKVGGWSVSASAVIELAPEGGARAIFAVPLPKKGVTEIVIPFTSDGAVAPGAKAVRRSEV